MQDPVLTFMPTADGRLSFRTSVPTCDFCGCRLRKSWSRFEAADFTTSMPTDLGEFRFGSEGFWAACRDGCAPLVRERRWLPLIERVLARWEVSRGPSPVGLGLERRWLAAMYLRLEENIGVETIEHKRSSKRRGGGRR